MQGSDTKVVIRSLKLKKDRQCNDQKKYRTKNHQMVYKQYTQTKKSHRTNSTINEDITEEQQLCSLK